MTSTGEPPADGRTKEQVLAKAKALADQITHERALADKAFREGSIPVAPPPLSVVPAFDATPDAVLDAEASAEPEQAGAPGSGWIPADMNQLLDSMIVGTYVPERPLIGMIDGAEVGIIYEGRISGIAGDSSSGKTWTALALGASEMVKGNVFVLVDLEDTLAGTLERLLDMGLDPEVVRTRFVYLAPETRFDLAAQGLVYMTVTERRPTLVAIDSVGEALAIEGKNPNADEEVAAWVRKLPRWLARLGPAVLLLDHVTKASEGKGDPSGTQRKKSAITGAQYNQQAQAPFRRGQAGHAIITCTKDRRGYWANGQVVAELHLVPRNDGTGMGDGGGAVAITLRSAVETAGGSAGAADSGPFRPTGLMQRVSIAVENAPSLLSYRSILDRVGGKREYVRIALDMLISEGYLVVEPGPRRAQLHRVAKPFRESAPGTWAKPEPDSVPEPSAEPVQQTLLEPP